MKLLLYYHNTRLLRYIIKVLTSIVNSIDDSIVNSIVDSIFHWIVNSLGELLSLKC